LPRCSASGLVPVLELGERHLLEATDLPVDENAGQVVFGGLTSLREHLHAAIGVSRSPTDAPSWRPVGYALT